MSKSLIGLLIVWTCCVSSGVAQETVNFSRQIRPLLAEKCFACHGPDEAGREGGLRLDNRDGLLGIGDSGKPAIVAGNPGASEVLRRIRTDDEAERMPPAEAGKEVTAEEAELLERWIAQGATWQQHWAFVAPERPSVPGVADDDWAVNEIDRFIAARLHQDQRRPAATADKTTLLRRATLALTGLPPTPQEVREFLSDDSPHAYEHVVGKLLESTAYGEHLARYWLDAARYGDTHGLHLDNFRMIWPYRDWVIQAFNQNMPFDQFTIEQLAGDLLPDATLSQQIATGFNRCNVTTSEGGALPEEYEVYYANDRVATMSTVWMGVTMGCVTCHDHKFDPFSMKDFYQLYAFFNNLDGPVMDGNAQDTAPVVRVANADQQRELGDLAKRRSEYELELQAEDAEADRDQAAWEQAYRAMMSAPTAWAVLAPVSYNSQRSASFERLEDNSLLVSGTNANQDVYEIEGAFPGGAISAVRLEGLSHPTLTAGGAGRSANSNVVLTEFEVEYAAASADPPVWAPVAWAKAWADHEQPDGDFKVMNAIDGKPETGWAINGHQRREDRVAMFLAEKPFGFAEGTRIRVRLRHESVYAQHQFGRVRLATTTAEQLPEFAAQEIPGEVAAAVQASAPLTVEQRRLVRAYYRQSITNLPRFVKLRDALAAVTKRHEELSTSLPTTLVWRDAVGTKQAHVLLRGAYDKPGDPVERNTPAALPPLAARTAGETPTRLDLARWLLTPEHPLTARVIVNRFWQQFFGVGLVETSEDFGSQGTPPSHPELLDWLAVDFRESGWDVKRLQKMIVMSATFRQSSQAPAELLAADPRNRLLARGPRFRMDAEAIRDSGLAASGLLVRTVGGPSVKPYQPPGIWEAVGYTDSNTAKFQRDGGSALYRRSLYTFWKRTAPPPMLATFDAPSRESCSVRRPRTNTPLAALALMNDEQFVEASRGLAARILREAGPAWDARLDYGFLLTTSRLPTDEERTVVREVLEGSLERYRQDEPAARELSAVGELPTDSSVDIRELAAWTIVANLLLNLDETISR